MSPSTTKPVAQQRPSPDRNRWMDWQLQVRITADSAESEPTQPSIPGCVGFVGSRLTASPIARAPISETGFPLRAPMQGSDAETTDDPRSRGSLEPMKTE